MHVVNLFRNLQLNPFGWFKKNQCERKCFPAYNFYHPLPHRKSLHPRIVLPIPNPHYHPRDLRLPSRLSIQEKLKREFDHAQAHMRGQKSNPEFLKLARQKAEFSIATDAPMSKNRQVGIAYAQGRRPTMEDAHIATGGVAEYRDTTCSSQHTAALCTSRIRNKSIQYELFGVIDGHGGSQTAHFIAAHVQQEIERAISKHGISDAGVFRALKEAIIQLDAKAVDQIKDGSGAVAVFTLRIGSTLWTANLGDCRAIVKIGDRVIQLTEDAKPTIPRFEKSIKKRGGVIETWGVPRVVANGIGVAVARAFNDQGILGTKGYYPICARPKISKFSLPPDADTLPKSKPIILIQACDGVWDVASSTDIAAAAGSAGTAQQAAAAIVGAALNSGSSDNCSALVAYLNFNPPSNATPIE